MTSSSETIFCFVPEELPIELRLVAMEDTGWYLTDTIWSPDTLA